MTSSNVSTIVGGIIAISLIGAVIAMALHGTISGTEAIAFLGGFVTLASGILGHALGVTAGAAAASSGATTPPAAAKQ